ncbi:MAG: CPBP family intramembrane glutamic endopeptidase [Allosphingosinicella sp.]
MTPADHVLALLLAAVSLSLAFLRPPQDAGIARRDFYLSGALTGLLFAGAVLAFWFGAGRPLLGFGLAGWRVTPTALVGGAAWVAALVLALWLARRGVLRGPLERLYRRYAWLMPRNGGELAGSWATSAAAGAGEEIAYRGFLLWYGASLLGPAGGLAASSLLFGAAHGYQRRFGMVFATGAGLALGLVYLATESLPLVMWMHATYNMASFTAGWMLLPRDAS